MWVADTASAATGATMDTDCIADYQWNNARHDINLPSLFDSVYANSTRKATFMFFLYDRIEQMLR
ncbi:MAG: hypothetical protein PHE41_06390 [Eubacteriales bacterium]|nr:hypothetical protein [Eubacteriales bacterium]